MLGETPLAQPKHRLLLELGRGGMGTVYLAVAEGPAGFNKFKVVKQLRPALASEPQFLQMFLEEARLAARLNHPNVVQTFEVAFDGQRFYLEMEYLEGQSLDGLARRLRRSERPFPRVLGVWILTQVLAGLGYAHELVDVSGKPLLVVHRDVSPHNIFVTYDGAVKVLDFGIAKVAGTAVETRSGVVKGKATYMSPEQASRRTVDRRADIFSVGVILWEILCGQRFWGELSDAQIFLKLESGVFESPRSIEPSVPETLDALCMRALAREPSERFTSAGEMQIALEDWLASTSERAGPRQVSVLMSDLFAERRAAVREEIEAQMSRAAGSPATVIDVPIARAFQEPSHPTGSGPISAEVLADLAARGTTSGGFDSAPDRTSAATPLGHAKSSSKPQRLVEGNADEEPTRSTSGTASEWPRRSTSRWAALVRGRGALVVAGATLLVAALGVARWRASAAPRAAHCASDAECTAGAPAGSKLVCASGTCTPAPACSGHGACTRSHGGRPHMCVDGECVQIQTDSCQILAEPGEAERDDTIWFGAMLPLTGALADTFGRPTLHAIDVARQDFARISRGLPSAEGNEPPRSMAVIACDDATSSDATLQHLAGRLRLQAIIGFGSSNDLVEQTQSVLIPKKILGLAALNMNPLLTSIPNMPGEPRMLWRTIPSYSAIVRPMAAVVAEIDEPLLQAAHLKDSAIRVACIRYSGPGGLGFDGLPKALRFNGKAAAENGDHYREFSMGVPGDGQSLEELVPQLIAFAPHVIIGPIREAVLRGLIMPLEDRWSSAVGYRPRYVSDGSFDAKSYYELFRAHPEWQKRFLSVNTPASTPANLAFTFRYNEHYETQVTPFDAYGMGYDAFYLLADAAYASDRSMTGASLARAIRRLVPPGERIDVGPSRILDVFSILRSGANVDLNGTVTTLDFDLRTGDPATDFAVNCPQRDDATKTVVGIESGVVYDAARGNLVGTLRCPLAKIH